MINGHKSFFIISKKAPVYRAQQVAACIINYLLCCLFTGIKKVYYFDNLIVKIGKKLVGWKSRLLSYAGSLILIKHVLQCICIHILASFNHIQKLLFEELMLFLEKKIGGMVKIS